MKRTLRQAVTATFAAAVAVTLLAGCSGRDVVEEPAEEVPAFPSGDITFVVPYNPGGNSDIAARALAPELESELGVSVVVENRAGANGTAGLGHVSAQAPDGHTLGLMTIDSILWKYQGYTEGPTDWDYIGQISATPTVIAVGPDSAYGSLAELVEAAKAAPDTVTIGLNGTGTNPEAVVRELEAKTGAVFRLVPFDGGAPAVTAAMGGQVDAVVAGSGETSQPHADGLLTVVAVLTENENAALPGVKTALAQGIDVVNQGWTIAVVPKGTPEDVKSILRSALKAAVASKSYVEVTEGVGNVPFYLDGDALTDFVSSEVDRVARVFG